tara:strand:+ start:985 stop:1155 length:171 start_codon:yes stop_codon:yes gene_type:complete
MSKVARNQKGQGMLEYVILTGLVGIFCLAAFKSMGKHIKTRVQNMNEKIVEEIKID